jgi:hypothetical protein
MALKKIRLWLRSRLGRIAPKKGAGMQIIGTESARVSYLVSWEEIRPLNGIPQTVLLPALVERYQFRFPPEPARNWAEAQSRITEFRGGVFESAGRQIPVLGIIAYSDALAVECFQTDDAEIVMADLMQWARDMGFRESVRPLKKLYVSRLVAKFDEDLEGLFGRWAELKALMIDPATAHYGDISPFGAFRIEFRSDANKIQNSTLLSNFIFERRNNEDYAENRYLCIAPLSSPEHKAFLEKVEALARPN